MINCINNSLYERVNLRVLFVQFSLLATFLFHSAVSQGQEISQDEVKDSVEKIAAAIAEHYFDVELSRRIQADLLSRLADNEYSQVQSRKELADQVTARLEEMTQDKHLVVSPRKPTQAEKPDASTDIDEERAAEERAARRELIGKRSNFGIQEFELLPGNVAYLNFTSFYRENEISDLLAAQMKLAANADAVILDMRYNMGGSAGAVSLLSSYFFEGPERKLFDVINRSGEATNYSTNPNVENRNESRPVFVLVHPTTFSAGEGLAFVLQDQKRATVVGQTTAGAANPGRPHFVNRLFEINIPNGQIKVANSGKNWEGTGVTPDIDSKGEDALLIAHRTAIQQLIDNTQDQEYKTELKSQLNELNK